ncbi:hypothetical protein F53441_3368 [Fusarium austroafricanum]|uniref:Uncharacterized protein n=1 Tax=Fusarium austroafricanum TaxID=2364996 RepID=A0A8H4PAS9_9HYPO|nr:hypothetical protein F53441_3368 [Fusarium austroafricanum]
MKYFIVLGLTAIFTGYALATSPLSCSTPGENTPITSSCCPRDPAKRLRRSAREIFARTDSPTCPTPQYYGDSCCTHEFAKPTLDKGTFNLQCGANGVADIVSNAVKVEIVGCDTAGDLDKDTCYLMISSTPAGTITDTHLEISTTPWSSTKYPTKDPASWTYTSYCGKTTGICQLPLKKIGDGASALCGNKLYIAYHTSTSDRTTSKTCTGDGTLIPGQPGNRWWEYLTLGFTCPKECDRWCCCQQPDTPPPSDCSVSGTAFAKPPSNADQQTLQGKGCGRWGWWNVFSGSSYEARLLVGAGNNVGGTDVGKVVVSQCTTDANKLTVTYTLDAPYKLTEVHVDLRCQPITKKVTGRDGTSGYPCAPGQYNVFKGASDGKMCPASTGKSRYTISCIDPQLYDDGDNLGYTCTSTTDPMYAIFHASVYNSGAGCAVGSCDQTDAGE